MAPITRPMALTVSRVYRHLSNSSPPSCPAERSPDATSSRSGLTGRCITAVVERENLIGWIDAYERAWRTPGTAPLEELFASDATYVASPFDPPLQGRETIKTFWEAERESAEEVFTLTREVIAVEGDLGVARVEVRYGTPPTRVYRDLWIVTLDSAGQCVAFEEWPFFPRQQRSAINSP